MIPRDALRLPRDSAVCILICGLFAGVVALGVASGRFELASGDILPVFGAIAILYACGAGLHRLRLPAIPGILKVLSLYFLLAATAALASAVLASTDRPYVDDRLAAADAWLGFRWLDVASVLHRHPLLQRLLVDAYFTLNWQPLLLIVLLTLFRRQADACRFVTTLALALVVTLAIFPFVPALAAYHYYHLAPTMLPLADGSPAWSFQAVIEGVRSGAIRVLDQRAFGSFVTMPSFHAASAVILARSFWTFRLLRVPASILNAAMLFAAIPVGGHYLVDAIAGTGVALLALAMTAPAVRAFDRVWEGWWRADEEVYGGLPAR